MIDHVYLSVTDIDTASAFYLAALRPLGWREIGYYRATSGPVTVPDLFGIGDAAYLSTGVGSSIWLRQRNAGETGLHLGIRCDSNDAVDASYAAAIGAGGIDEWRPAERTYFAPGYYAANVADTDGNRLELAHKTQPQPHR
jgi:catechol 2,3-dioxygenase-like lactoylglutathione lyase family enzyme